MNVLIVADTHGRLMQRTIAEVLNGRVPDVVFILGDLSYNDIEALKDYHGLAGIPMYGVVGNHDERNALKDHGITDIHMSIVKVGSYTVGGFGGSIRYKPTDYYMMHSNKESEELLEMLTPCDILITHDKPRFEPIDDAEFPNSHSGLTGIAKYIERCKPSYVFHGHLHDPYFEVFEHTAIRCFYGVEWLELPLHTNYETARISKPLASSDNTSTVATDMKNSTRKGLIGVIRSLFQR